MNHNFCTPLTITAPHQNCFKIVCRGSYNIELLFDGCMVYYGSRSSLYKTTSFLVISISNEEKGRKQQGSYLSGCFSSQLDPDTNISHPTTVATLWSKQPIYFSVYMEFFCFPFCTLVVQSEVFVLHFFLVCIVLFQTTKPGNV